MFDKKYFFSILIISVLFASAVVSIFLAYQVGKNAAQLASLDQIATIVTVLLAFIFLKERDSMGRKIIATIICFIGVLLVT